MADKKQQPSPPPQRTSATPFPGISQIGSNIASNWHPIDWAKQTAQSIWQSVRHPGETFEGMKKALQAAEDLKNAAWQERSGKWPKSYTLQDQRRAAQIYRSVTPYFTYVDPKTKERHLDAGAITNIATQNPMDILATLATMGSGALGSLGLKAEEAAAALKQAGSVRRTMLSNWAANTAKVGEKGLQATSFVLNPVPATVSKTTQIVAPTAVKFVKGGTKVFDKDGDFTPQVQQAFARQGIDTAIFDTPQSRAAIENVLKRKGISDASIREARGAAAGVPVTRSMATREAAPRRVAADTAAVREAGQQNISGQMGETFGASPDASNLGASFARSYTNAKNAVTNAYTRAFRQPGVFTNTDDFATGAMQSVERELNNLGLSASDIMSNPRFSQSQRALGGFRREGRTFGGLQDQLNELAGNPSAAAPATVINDLSGVPHTRGPNGAWIDPAGNPVTAPGKINYLDAIEKSTPRAALPEAGPNRLTPQNIDSVRRNNNAFYADATSPEDRSVLAAINRGIDNYVEQNAGNFSGNGEDLARNLKNARSANQEFLQNYSQSTNKGIRDASSIVERNSTLDPEGAIKFTGNPADIGAHFESRIINPKTLATPTNYTGANTVTGDRMFNDLHNLLDPEGQQALTNTVRNTIATSPASPAEVTSAANRYNFIFTPEESNLLSRLQTGREVITDPALGPSTLSENRFAPTVRRVLASGLGSYLGTHVPIVGPVMGGMLTTGIDDAYELSRLKNIGSKEFAGAPPAVPNIPSLTTPLQYTGSAANIGQNGITNLPAQQQPPVPVMAAPKPEVKQQPEGTDWLEKAVGPDVSAAPVATPSQFSYDQIFGSPKRGDATAAAPKRFTGEEIFGAAPQPSQMKPASPPKQQNRYDDPYRERIFAPLKDEETLQPQMYRGGRAAYKSGGAVKDIEPLVRNLMNRAQQAKKITNKTTEPLLNAHDDAIASALATAQKAI